MVLGRGVEYYYSTYTHVQLWKMIIDHSDWWGVEESRLFWRQARHELENNAASLRRELEALEAYWTGRDADAFQERAGYVVQYNEALVEDMRYMEVSVLPHIARMLREVHERAHAAGLNPVHWADRDEWIEDHARDLRRLSERGKYDAYRGFRDEQHLMMAEAVAWLGDRYQELIAASDLHASNIDVSRLPGADTYEPPRGGVYGLKAEVPSLEEEEEPRREDPLEPDEDDEVQTWTMTSYEDDAVIGASSLWGPVPRAQGAFGDGGDWRVGKPSKLPVNAAVELGRKLAREKARDGLPGDAAAEDRLPPERRQQDTDDRSFFDVGWDEDD